MNLIFVAGLAEKIKEWFAGWFGAIFSIIPKTLYFLCTLIFQVLDILQVLVRKVAGLDVYYVSNTVGGTSDSAKQTGDIAQRFITEIFTGQNSVLSNVFWALIILGLIMLIITTFVAVLRSEYQGITDGKAASKGRIIGRAFKAIAAFAIVPVVCYFGIFLANVILKALDTITTGTQNTNFTYSDSTGKTQSVANKFMQGKTETGVNTYIGYSFGGFANTSSASGRILTTSTPISGLIFKACGYQANRIRNFSSFRSAMSSNPSVGAGVFNQFGTDYDTSANLLDDCFANCYRLNEKVSVPTSPFHKSHMWPLSTGIFGAISDPSIMDNVQVFDKNNVTLVWYYYDLWSFNFIICVAALIVCTKLLISLVFGLMKRLFEVVVLFLIAPPIASLMPLDDGSALKKWQSKFVGKVIGAYGPVVGLNLMFLILPFIMQIRFFNMPFVDAIINVFLVIVGLLTVKDVVATISELIGAEDTLASGEKMAGDVGQTIQKVGKVATAPAKLAVKGASAAISIGHTGMTKHRMNKMAKADEQNNAKLEAIKNIKNPFKRALVKHHALKEMRSNLSEDQKKAARNPILSKISSSINKSYNNAVAEAGAEAAGARAGAQELYGDGWDLLSKKEQKQATEDFKKDKYNESYLTSLKGAKRKAGNKWDSMSKKEKKKAVGDYQKSLNDYDNAIERANNNDDIDTDYATLYYSAKELADKQLGGMDAVEKNRSSVQKDITKAKETSDSVKDNIVKDVSETVAKGRGKPDELTPVFAKGAKEFAKAFSDVVKTLGPELGGSMAKGFKDAGGIRDIFDNITGGAYSKRQDDSKAIKDAVNQLKAQQSAQTQVGGNQSSEKEVKLSESSAQAIANAILKGMPKK
ncbi:MAG: hypothetical protein MR423_02175 [Firmicutes bacterium]|nr:hypothetical protein [Bacillota bacterium]MDY3659263.1 hypothetical protein [Eubacteriales bacterium]